MTLTKSQIKIAVINDVGRRLDDMREAAIGQQHQTIGAKDAAAQISTNIKKLIKVIEQDFESGEISKVIEKGDLEVLKMIKTYFSRAESSCDITAQHFESLKKKASGKIEAFEQSVKLVKKMQDLEQAKVDVILAAVKSGEASVDDGDVMMISQSSVRPVGSHPGKTLKQQRLAQEAQNQLILPLGDNGEPVTPTSSGKSPRKRNRPGKKKVVKKSSRDSNGTN